MRILFCVSVVLCILKSIHSSGTDSDDDGWFETIFAKLHDLETGMSELREENRNLMAQFTTTSTRMSEADNILQNKLNSNENSIQTLQGTVSTNAIEIANTNEEMRIFKEKIQSEVERKNISMESLLAINKDLQTEVSKLRKNSSASISGLQANVSQNSQGLQNLEVKTSKAEMTIRNILSNPYCKPKSCLEVQSVFNIRTSGVYRIFPIPTEAGVTEVYCDLETEGGGWTVFQSRSDKGPRVDFYRDWADYEKGFGIPGNEHWMGLQNLAAMTSSGDQELLIKLGDWNNQFGEAKYSTFKVADGIDKYRLMIGNFTGNADTDLKEDNQYLMSHNFQISILS